MRTIAILCREIDKNTGNISAYPVCKDTAGGYDISYLRLRQRYNPELSFWIARTNTETIQTIIHQLHYETLNERMLQQRFRCVRI